MVILMSFQPSSTQISVTYEYISVLVFVCEPQKSAQWHIGRAKYVINVKNTSKTFIQKESSGCGGLPREDFFWMKQIVVVSSYRYFARLYVYVCVCVFKVYVLDGLG